MSCHFSAQSSIRSRNTGSGFGLIELMVSISIMLLIAATLLARQGSFNGAILLRSQAYEVALSAREIQLNAVSAISIQNNYRTLLGLHFDTSRDATYRVFRDIDNDGFHDANEEFGQQGTIDSRFELRAIRTIGDSYTGTGLSVVFERPNFDARFFDSAGEVNASSVEIDISKRDQTGTGNDIVRTIEVTSTGQITVQ